MATKPEKDKTPAAEEKKPAAKVGGAEEAQAITVNAQFIKDLSFEAPAAPSIFSLMQESPPDINVNINVNANPLQDKVFEVIIGFQAKCKVKEQVAFILELEYAGVFTLNVPDEHLQPILLIECPRLLFPFARNILADVSRDGGFSPLMVGPVDFAAMFQAQLQELQKAQASDGAATAPLSG